VLPLTTKSPFVFFEPFVNFVVKLATGIRRFPC
jgi:hypothetical protein